MPAPVPPGKYFLTGGAGFIGSHMTERLVETGREVTIFDNLAIGHRRWLDEQLEHPNVHFIEGDITDGPALTEAMRGHDIVIHFAANTDLNAGNADYRRDLYNCTVGTNMVLETMRTLGIGTLLFASSGCVYGEYPVQPLREEYGPLQPISLYGAAKLGGEAMIAAYSHLFGLRAFAFRFGNVVGDRMGRGVIHDFIRKLNQDSHALEILGDGKQEKDYILVEDIIDGMFHGLAHSPKQYDVFNLGTGISTNVTRLAEIVSEVLGLRDVRFRYTGGDRGWPGDQPIIRYDVSKLAALGWRTRCDSDESVRRAATILRDRFFAPAGH